MGAEKGETGKRYFWGNGDRELILPRGLGELERLEDRICPGNCVEEGGGVDALGVEGWVGGGYGTVLCAGEGKILSCEEVSRKKEKVGRWYRMSPNIPVGILMTTQPFKKAIVIACSSITVFPLPLSPTKTRRIALPRVPELISSISFAISSVSFLINIAGLLNKGQP